jgi:hypothetical protein
MNLDPDKKITNGHDISFDAPTLIADYPPSDFDYFDLYGERYKRIMHPRYDRYIITTFMMILSGETIENGNNNYYDDFDILSELNPDELSDEQKQYLLTTYPASTKITCNISLHSDYEGGYSKQTQLLFIWILYVLLHKIIPYTPGITFRFNNLDIDDELTEHGGFSYLLYLVPIALLIIAIGIGR